MDIYFEPFMAFFFPQAHQDIDWLRGYDSLDTELQEIIRDSETGRRLADKLVKLWLLDGEEAVVLIHIEVQSQSQSDFAKWMYIYNHRLFDKYDREVISLAILADDRLSWRPTSYSYSRWGFQTTLQFPTVKLLDYRQQWQILEQSRNPFAVIVMAHLTTLATRENLQQRLQSKLSLIRELGDWRGSASALQGDRGYSRNEILQLFRLIEWMMVLPEELERNFRTELKRYREENRMPYITGFERDAIAQNTRESTIEVLQIRFETVPENINQILDTIENLPQLKQLHRQAVTVDSLQEFEQILAQIQTD
ncbi:transposase [Oscillatoria salina IIICB1]|nr:transposase [Oscillatoria salina IIICB1]